MHRPGSDALRKLPGDFGWLTGVAGVDPVDVPVLFEREDETNLKGAARSDAGRERYEFGGKVLGFDRAGAAVADGLQLRVRRGEDEEGTDKEKKRLG